MTSALGTAVALGWLPSAVRFRRALRRPAEAQRESLARVLACVRGSAQAQRIPGFSRLSSPGDFQAAVPFASAEDYAPFVARQAAGARAELTGEPVVRYELTGGSSGPSKLVPYTRGLLAELDRALGPWLRDLFLHHPGAAAGPGYWSVSPLGAAPRHTAAGIPIGATDDAAYFPGWLQPLLRRVFAVPAGVAALPDVASARYVTLRLLLEAPRLAFASVWNPSFLTLLFEALDGAVDRLADDLAQGTCRVPEPRESLTRDEANGRAARIAAVLSRLPWRALPGRAALLRSLARASAPLDVLALWPRLALVSTWTDAQAARALPALVARLPGVCLQGKGLLSTEAVVSIPLEDAPAPVLAVRSPFFEFLDAEAPAQRPKLAHELERHRTYEVVLSTAGGFLRYRLGDLVRVEGHLEETPCLRFVGRVADVSDLVGEKLHAARVAAAFAAVPALAGASLRFLMLAPEWGAPPAYHLFVEGELTDQGLAEAANDVDHHLAENPHYRYARQLGQLGPVRPVRVRDGARRYEARLAAGAQRAGVIKPADLHPRAGWLAHFSEVAS